MDAPQRKTLVRVLTIRHLNGRIKSPGPYDTCFADAASEWDIEPGVMLRIELSTGDMLVRVLTVTNRPPRMVPGVVGITVEEAAEG